MFFRGLTESDKEFIKETTKTDLQREKENTEKAYKDIAKLELENMELKQEIVSLVKTLQETYQYFQRNDYEIPILLDEPKIKKYTSENISADFVRIITIPVADLVKKEMEEKINQFYSKYKSEIEKE